MLGLHIFYDMEPNTLIYSLNEFKVTYPKISQLSFVHNCDRIWEKGPYRANIDFSV